MKITPLGMPKSLRLRPATQLGLAGRRLIVLGMLCGLAATLFATAGSAEDSAAAGVRTQNVSYASVPQSAAPLLPEQQDPASPSPKPEANHGLQVTYEGQQLTINAENASIAEILKAVQKHTGGELDFPASAAAERIPSVQLGPASARAVLSELLSWTSFDYIIQDSDKNPIEIQSVLLAVRTKGPRMATAGSLAAAYRQQRPEPPPVEPEPAPSPVEAPAVGNSAPPQQPDAPPDTAPRLMPGHETTPGLTPNRTGPTPTTTDQMIQQLQQMYQQRRQIQQETNRTISGT